MHIIVRTFTGKIFTINVLPTDNIIVIKKEILLETGILVENQRLTFLTNLLNDDDVIQNKRIRNEDTLYLHTLKYVCDS